MSITIYSSSGISNVLNQQASADLQQAIKSLSNRERPIVTLENLGLDALSTADSKPLSNDVVDTVTFATTYKPLMEAELQQESYIIANYNGKDYHLYDPENAKYLDDPNLKVTETGYLSRQIQTGQSSWTIQILGKAVDAPEYVPPKYTADFFDASSDFIMKAAQEYAKTGADETLDMPYYSSDEFVSSVLDFFSSGTATQTDFEITKASIESIIKELAEMLRHGEDTDLNNLKSKVDIMGEEISLTQLLDIQKYAKELSGQLTGENNEKLRFGNDYVTDFAHRGLIKSMGMAYGDQIGGAIGEMFKSAWEAEIDRHSEVIKNMGDYAVKDEPSALHSDMLKNGAQFIYDVFSKIDTSSKENALKSYNNLSGEIDAAINKFLDQYTGGAGSMAAKMRDEVDSYFYDLMGLKSVDVLA